jgi:hypothetical protein
VSAPEMRRARGPLCTFAHGQAFSTRLRQVLADSRRTSMGLTCTSCTLRELVALASSLSSAEKKHLEASKKLSRQMARTRCCKQPGRAASRRGSTIRRLAPSWIIDRFHSWPDSHGDIENSFSKDEFLTNIILYWVTQTIGSSVFSYYADAQSPSLTPADHVDQPVALALFPKDAGGIPLRSFVERTLNVQRWTEMPRGSHFASLEDPELYARDVVEFLRPLRTVQERPHPCNRQTITKKDLRNDQQRQVS